MKRFVWAVLGGLGLVCLTVAACTPASVESTEPTNAQTTTQAPATTQVIQQTTSGAQKPVYGGIFRHALTSDITNFDFFTTYFAPGITDSLTNDGLTAGDWAKGPAGGYGSDETSWPECDNLVSHRAGMLAQSWKWTADATNDQATLVYEIRQGVHFALDQNSDASKLVGGREMTADDVVYTLRLLTQDPRCYVYNASPELRSAQIEKTGQWEVSVTVPMEALMTAFTRLNYWGRVIPKEVIDKYGNMADWRNSVGTGPFMLTDFVGGSSATLKKNPNYWMKNPVGPGKGDQLPYVDGISFLIVTDASTRYAAVRTGKIDQIMDVGMDDATSLSSSSPQLKELQQPIVGAGAIFMRTDQSPFNDIRVRQALLMATDLNQINQGLYQGKGVTQTWPWPDVKGYENAYMSLDNPNMPQSVKDLYQYNPDKAKQLLSEAGYPDGFKTTALLTTTDADYYSILKDMWSKVGVDMSLDIVDIGVEIRLLASGQYPAIASFGVSLPYMYYYMPHLTGASGTANPGKIKDQTIDAGLTKINTILATTEDENSALSVWGKDLLPYLLGQAYAIPRVAGPTYNFWWPWVKNYSGEQWLGGDLDNAYSWYPFIWIDQSMKSSMGY